MNITEFQRQSIRTMKVDEETLLHCCMGMAGEVGEVIDIIKKSYFYGKDFDKKKVEEELGDVMFYISNLATSLNISMENVLENNVEKLRKRYPNGFSKEDAIIRRDYNESSKDD